MKQNRLPDVLGLRLSRQALRVLKERGIFAHSPVIRVVWGGRVSGSFSDCGKNP